MNCENIKSRKLTKKKVIFIILLMLIIIIPSLYYIISSYLPLPLPIYFVETYVLWSEGNANDWVNNLASDVNNAKELSGLRKWADDVMKRYREGTLKTIGPAKYVPSCAEGGLKLDPNEIDKQIVKFWSKPMFGLPPEAIICVSNSGEPKYVGYCWYLKGVIITGPNYHSLDFKYYYAVEAKPGIFAYSIEK